MHISETPKTGKVSVCLRNISNSRYLWSYIKNLISASGGGFDFLRSESVCHVFKLTFVVYFPVSLTDNHTMASHTAVSIRILDVNDNPPELATPYEASICEDAKAGQVSFGNSRVFSNLSKDVVSVYTDKQAGGYVNTSELLHLKRCLVFRTKRY